VSAGDILGGPTIGDIASCLHGTCEQWRLLPTGVSVGAVRRTAASDALVNTRPDLVNAIELSWSVSIGDTVATITVTGGNPR
jgi:hypothetical protein